MRQKKWRREWGTMEDDDQVSEYDTESESEFRNLESEDEDEVTFIQTVTTRSGRTIRVTSKHLGVS